MKKRQTINSADLNKIIQSCTKLDQKSFTIILKQIERMSGGKYCCLNDKQAQYVFDESIRIFEKNDSPIVKYNALRLAKYGVDTGGIISRDYKKPWSLYLETISHPDGRVRMAGIHLLERYYFGIAFDLSPDSTFYRRKNKKTNDKSEEVGRFIVDMFLYLQDLEDKYIQEHEEKLDEDDFPDFAGKIPWASDTKDKFLKSIRMGTEVFCLRGPLEGLMEKFGYRQKTSDEFPDLTIFQRYEKNQNNEIITNSKNLHTYIIRVKLQNNKKSLSGY